MANRLLVVLLALPDSSDARWEKYEAILKRFDYTIMVWRRQYVINPPSVLWPQAEATTVEALQAELDAVKADDEWVNVSHLKLMRVQIVDDDDQEEKRSC